MDRVVSRLRPPTKNLRTSPETIDQTLAPFKILAKSAKKFGDIISQQRNPSEMAPQLSAEVSSRDRVSLFSLLRKVRERHQRSIANRPRLVATCWRLIPNHRRLKRQPPKIGGHLMTSRRLLADVSRISVIKQQILVRPLLCHLISPSDPSGPLKGSGTSFGLRSDGTCCVLCIGDILDHCPTYLSHRPLCERRPGPARVLDRLLIILVAVHVLVSVC